MAYDVLYKMLQIYISFKRKWICENKASFINQIKGFLLEDGKISHFINLPIRMVLHKYSADISIKILKWDFDLSLCGFINEFILISCWSAVITAEEGVGTTTKKKKTNNCG